MALTPAEFPHSTVADALAKLGHPNTELRPAAMSAMEAVLADQEQCRTFIGVLCGEDAIKRKDAEYLNRYQRRATKILREFLSLAEEPEPRPESVPNPASADTSKEVDTGSASSDGPTVETTEEEASDMAAKKKGTRKAAAPRTPKKREGTKPGVISTIVDLLKNGGGTVDQLHAKLVRKFPDRDPDGMKTTLKIQLSRLVKNKTIKKIEKEKEEGKPIHYSA